MDVVEHAEMVEKELDAFIERRSRKEPDPDELSPSYQESVRRFHAGRQEYNRNLWICYFRTLARSHARLAAENEAKAAALLAEGEGVGT
jgi:hypothetical protein